MIRTFCSIRDDERALLDVSTLLGGVPSHFGREAEDFIALYLVKMITRKPRGYKHKHSRSTVDLRR